VHRRLLEAVAWPSLRLPHVLALLLCLTLGCVANLYRTAWRPAGEAHAFRGFWPQTGEVDREVVRWSRGYAKAEVLGYAWRPMRWRVQLAAPPEAPPTGAAVKILVNDVHVTDVTVGHKWQTIEFIANPPPAADVAVQFYSTEYGDRGVGVGVGRVTVEPVLTFWNALTHGLSGAFVGLIFWALMLIAPAGDTEGAADASHTPAVAPRWSIARALVALLIVWVYLGIWMVLKPPQQAPDEVQHLLRASSVRLQPWATRTPNWLTLDDRFLNPFVRFPTGDIADLFFNRQNHLSYERIARMKARPWDATPLPPGLTTYPTPLATYPTGYYAPMFVLAEATTKLLDLTPYQNTYAYRAWTVIAAGLLWLLVYRALLVIPGVSPHANIVFAFLLLNPMLAFVSSSASPDSVNVPLATLAILLTYRTFMTGGHAWLATLALVACGLTKPSIILIFAALPIPALLLWRSGAIPLSHLVTGGIAIARAAVISYAAFYAWSPPRFFGSAPVRVTLEAYATGFPSRLPGMWIQYWGRLGWTDYELTAMWYTVLFGIVVIAAIVAVLRTADETRRFARFAALVFLGYFACMVVGEYWNLSAAGYNFQGRHLLPVSIGIAGVVMSKSRITRWSVVGFVALMNVMLMHESIVRYFGGDWGVFRASWP
jgi:hypothetical protein